MLVVFEVVLELLGTFFPPRTSATGTSSKILLCVNQNYVFDVLTYSAALPDCCSMEACGEEDGTVEVRSFNWPFI